ncbi:MAG TPA: hypothetical protein ENI23_12370 [bacterium]|nr:hypothetical protein [bacterium]
MVEKIIELLESKDIDYEHLKHEPTPTSEDSAKVRGTKMEEGIKAIILAGKKTGKNLMVCVPSNLKLNIKEIEKEFGEKIHFEKPELIKERFNLVIGGVPPFGNLLDIPTYFDKKILDEERAVFNSGTQTDSLIMTSADLIKVGDPILGNFSQS